MTRVSGIWQIGAASVTGVVLRYIALGQVASAQSTIRSSSTLSELLRAQPGADAVSCVADVGHEWWNGHRPRCDRNRSWALVVRTRDGMARPAGLEPATLGLEGRCSIHLSYGRVEALILAQSPSMNGAAGVVPWGRRRM